MVTGLILSAALAATPQLAPAGGRAAALPNEKPGALFSGLFDPAVTGGGETRAGEMQPGDFQQPRVLPPVRRASNPRTKIVCGMTLLIVGSDNDPEMPRPAPKEGVTYTMRRYPPPACGKESGKEK